MLAATSGDTFSKRGRRPMQVRLGDDGAGPGYADVLALDEAQRLLERGLEAGFLTQDEIVLALDDLDLDASAIDDVYRALELAQVDVVASEDGDEREPVGGALDLSTREIS